ncbi:MAG: PIG-L deacetylase family protein [Peptostreptococcaceae bacterium]
MKKTILLLGVYGMESVECGGVLAKNVKQGGRSIASIMLAGDKMKENLIKSSEILGIEMSYTNFESYNVNCNLESKKKLVREIRKYKPDIIITQDPHGCIHDFDPDRRMAMILILEAISLCSRDFHEESINEFGKCKTPTIYYMFAHDNNTVVDICDVWEEKNKAMHVLESQMEFSGKHYETYYGNETMKKIVPNWDELDTYLEKGRQAQKQFDYALYLSNGMNNHGKKAFSEVYRKEGMFYLDNLTV